MLIWRNDKSFKFWRLEVGQLFFSKTHLVQTSMVPPKNDIFSEKMRCGKIFQCPPKFLKLEYENNFKNANVEFFPQLDESIVWFLGKIKLPNFCFQNFTNFLLSYVYSRITVILREKRDFGQIEVVVEVSVVTIAKKLHIGPQKNAYLEKW